MTTTEEQLIRKALILAGLYRFDEMIPRRKLKEWAKYVGPKVKEPYTLACHIISMQGL